MSKVRIGVLSLQGAIEAHEEMLRLAASELHLDIEIARVILPDEIAQVDGLVIPGGESTAMRLIGEKNGMLAAVEAKLKDGLPAFGTCAGAILLSKSVRRNYDSQSKKGVFPHLNIEIVRNGYGRQRESFSTNLQADQFDSPIPGIFIRAPVISGVEDNVVVMAKVADKPVLIKQNNIIASTFHPELSDNTSIHKMFLQVVVTSLA